MLEEYLFVELAEISGRTFQVLKHVAEQEGANDLSRLSAELDSFGRYFDLALSSLLEVMSDTRTIRVIESAIRMHVERRVRSSQNWPPRQPSIALVLCVGPHHVP